MPRKNRLYKKGEPFRDARLFVIIAEGQREDIYFQWFNERNSRIQVLVISSIENESAPILFLKRIEDAEKEGRYSPTLRDEVWFVCDVDRWRAQIENLRVHCEQHPNWNIAVSNPCFEVWLHFHSGELEIGKEIRCKELKTTLPKSNIGEFNMDNYGPLLLQASQNARNSDQTPDAFFPDAMRSKVYKLAESMLAVLGNNWV